MFANLFGVDQDAGKVGNYSRLGGWVVRVNDDGQLRAEVAGG